MTRTFAVTMTGRDFAEANWLLVRTVWLRRWGWLIPLVGALFGLFLALAARHFHPDTPPARLRSLFVKGMLFTLAFAGLQLFLLLRVILRAGRPLPGSPERQVLTYALDPQALSLTSQNVTSAYPWPRFRRMIETDSWLLLIRGGLSFCAFPKSQLDPEALIALKRGFANAQTSARS